MNDLSKRKTTGVSELHRARCGSLVGSRCDCRPRYCAEVYDRRKGRKHRRNFRSRAEAIAWREARRTAMRRGEVPAARMLLHDFWERLLLGMIEGAVLNRSGDRFKPSVIRGYEEAMRNYVLPELGGLPLGEITRRHLQYLVDRMHGQGLSPSTIRNKVMPMRLVSRRAMRDGDIAINPTVGLELPTYRGRRDRVASPSEAAALLAALQPADRAVWATALYGGLRRGELLALRWEDVDFDRGVIRVERSWDAKEGALEPKSRAGHRAVPLTPMLREHLLTHALATGRRAGLVFGRTATTPLSASAVGVRAKKAWTSTGLSPITLHEARHTFASLMIAARVPPKSLSVYMGHSSIVITLDLYGHLLPGDEATSAALLDELLRREFS